MPSCLMECVPGDKVTLSNDLFLRFAPMIAPIMHRVDATVHYFFVPNRIVWDNWTKFITNEPTGGIPQITMDGSLSASQKKLADYLGVPPMPAGGTPTNVNAIPFAAYQCVYNEYYRDQNLIAPVDYKLEDGLNPVGELATMRKRAWEHDYFTASLPFAQKGQAVDIPLGDVTYKDGWYVPGSGEYPNWKAGSTDTTPAGGGTLNTVGSPFDPQVDASGLSSFMAYDPNGSLEVTPTTINSLRRAFKLQEWLEKNARGGTRYIENILMHFGVKSSDARLQRPEYITGTKTNVIISEVLNTTGQTSGLPQGNMAGHGVAVGGGYKGTYRCEEHGYIIGIMSVMPKTAYQQGIPKNYLKNDPLSFYWPSFANIGEQEVQNQEIFAYTPSATGTFGYVPRYAEYKYLPSRVAGEFRTTLSYWHLGRIFSGLPALNQDFIEVAPENVTRIFAVTSTIEDNLYIECLNKIHAIRPMPVFGTPML